MAKPRTILLIVIAPVVFAAGALALLHRSPLWPLLDQMTPAPDARDLAKPLDLALDSIAPGGHTVVRYRGAPVIVVRVDPRLRESLGALTPRTWHARPVEVEVPAAVFRGTSSHLGCLLQHVAAGEPPGWAGGFRDPCHGFVFDYAGRALRPGTPAPAGVPDAAAPDLERIPFEVVDTGRIRLGSSPAH